MKGSTCSKKKLDSPSQGKEQSARTVLCGEDEWSTRTRSYTAVGESFYFANERRVLITLAEQSNKKTHDTRMRTNAGRIND